MVVGQIFINNYGFVLNHTQKSYSNHIKNGIYAR